MDKFTRNILGLIVLGLLGMSAVYFDLFQKLQTAVINPGSSAEQKVYFEGFSDPRTVDAGAGKTKGLDETMIQGGKLVQKRGQYPSSLSFDGVDEYVTFGDILDDVFAGNAAKFTVFVRFKRGNLTGNQTLISKYDSGVGGWEWLLRLDDEGNPHFFWVDDNFSNYRGVVSKGGKLNDTDYHTLLIKYDRTQSVEFDNTTPANGIISMEVDGEEAKDLVMITQGGSFDLAVIKDTSGPLVIGAFNSQKSSPSQAFKGNIDEVAVVKGLKETSDFADGNLEPRDLSELSGLVGWWRMGDGDSFPTISDASGKGNQGTMINMEAKDIMAHAPGAEQDLSTSTEILGPIIAGTKFQSFQASVAGEDANHTIKFQFLSSNAKTLISDGLIPGNANGFRSTDLPIDLSKVNAGNLYVKITFSNVVEDDASAALNSFSITYLSPPTPKKSTGVGIGSRRAGQRRGETVSFQSSARKLEGPEFYAALERANAAISGKVLTYTTSRGNVRFYKYVPGRISTTRMLQGRPQRPAYRGIVRKYNYRRDTVDEKYKTSAPRGIQSRRAQKRSLGAAQRVEMEWERKKQLLLGRDRYRVSARASYIRKYSDVQSVLRAREKRKKRMEEKEKQKPTKELATSLQSRIRIDVRDSSIVYRPPLRKKFTYREGIRSQKFSAPKPKGVKRRPSVRPSIRRHFP